MRALSPSVLFAATAGPRRGFGHLVRCGVLADALGVRRMAVLRGLSSPTRRIAGERLGWELVSWREAISRRPALIVVDDPSAAHRRATVRRARRAGIPVAAVHDGRSRRASADLVADLVIDGSVMARPSDTPHRVAGPAFTILRPAGAVRRPQGDRQHPMVVIALGGGMHASHLGGSLAAAIVRRLPTAHVRLAAGFAPRRLPALPPRCRWMTSPGELRRSLADASAAVVAGGITLYEACALGTPSVAVAVVPGQRAAVRAMARAGAVLRGMLGRTTSASDIAGLVARLLEQPGLERALRRRAQALVDGRGATRVAGRLLTLIHCQQKDTSDAAA